MFSKVLEVRLTSDELTSNELQIICEVSLTSDELLLLHQFRQFGCRIDEHNISLDNVSRRIDCQLGPISNFMAICHSEFGLRIEEKNKI